jgi:hypothetical protein
MTVGTDVVYQLWVVAMVITMTISWGFIWFGHFLLLLKLAKMLNLGFDKFCKLVV